MTVLTPDALDEILDYLDASIVKLKEETAHNPEFQMSGDKAIAFFDGQYEVRLQNLLSAKKSNIHHLESGMKNKVIQRKKTLLERIR